MTETSGFFNSLDPNNPDRVYDASFFSQFFKYFIPDGVSVQGGGLAVTASGTSMVSTVANGAAFIQGYNYNNDTSILLTHATADPTYDRIDRIVARLDRTEGVRAINVVIKQGTPAASPVEPSLQSDAYTAELPIAKVLITHALSTISQAKITDERGTLLDPIQYWSQIASINAQLANKTNNASFTNTGVIGMTLLNGVTGGAGYRILNFNGLKICQVSATLYNVPKTYSALVTMPAATYVNDNGFEIYVPSLVAANIAANAVTFVIDPINGLIKGQAGGSSSASDSWAFKTSYML